MRYFPIFFDLRAQRVLVVGGGEVALRKITLLERTGARITVVAPEILPELLTRATPSPRNTPPGNTALQAAPAAAAPGDALGNPELAAADAASSAAPAHGAELSATADSSRPAIEFHRREFQPADLDGVRLVIVATSKPALNRWIATLAEARAVPVNVVDDRDASRFIVPAIVDRDPVLVAVSTAGTSPVLARRLRERLEAFIPTRFGALALWLRELRQSALERLRDTAERRRYFETLVDGPAARRFIEGDRRGAERIAQHLLASSAQSAPAAGEVTLVGAGPGDPDLLTIKALRALQDADVILYDRLVAPAILDLARRDAARICVGKSPRTPRADAQASANALRPGINQSPPGTDAHTAQADINAALIEHARAGRRVVRLKGGDPFIFGRGGEELEALAAAGIAFTVIPGITAAAGCAAYAGIPLTHRDHAQTVSFVTGHEDPLPTDAAAAATDSTATTNGAPRQSPRADARALDWHALARPNHTVVFYMGLARIERIAQSLIRHGAPASRPAALIAQGTTAHQRVVTATLGTIAAAASTAALPTPALLIVGDVVSLQASLQWFAPLASQDISQSA